MSATLSLKTLAHACRSLSTMLESGVEVRRAFKLAANKVSDARCREAGRQAINRAADFVKLPDSRRIEPGDLKAFAATLGDQSLLMQEM